MNWLERITIDSHRAVATKAGLSQSTVWRAATAESPEPSVVIAVARAYGAPVTVALRNAGVLTTEELKQTARAAALAEVPAAELLHELLRRELDTPPSGDD